MIIHNIMDESLDIHLSIKQLEKLMYEKDHIETLQVEVDGQITEITIRKKEEWSDNE